MPILIADPPPPAVQELLDQRRRMGADHHDEVWEGVLHMAPSPTHAHGDVAIQLAAMLYPLARAAGLYPTFEFNIGHKDDFRIPDMGLHRERDDRVYHETAALAVEVASPGDESWKKFDFYAAHHVDEVLIVDPLKRTVDWFALDGDTYKPAKCSGLIDLGAEQAAARIDWPPVS